MTIKVAVATQFGAEDAKTLVANLLQCPAVLKLEFEETMQWRPGVWEERQKHDKD